VRVGLLGGTFDPIHWGHIEMAETALTLAGLAEVHMVTAVTPPHKSQRTASNFLDRHAMVALALMNRSHLIPSSIEYGRNGKSYSVDTIQQLQQLAGASSEVFFIMGLDAFLDISSWKDFERLPQLCRFLIFARPGFLESELKTRIPSTFLKSVCVIKEQGRIPLQLDQRFYLYRKFSNDISSTIIREGIRRGEDLSEQLPPGVSEYITKNHLYVS